MIHNPFPFSNDNKRYHTWNYYLRSHYGKKVCKIPLNANLSCPNRDGVCGVGGCTFCSALGSGDYAGQSHDSITQQLIDGRQMMEPKWPHALAIAYFQAYTNTYAPLSVLQSLYEPLRHRDDIVAVSIATRADCLSEDIVRYLSSYHKDKPLWIELGLQTIHDSTAKKINRGHDFTCFQEAVTLLRQYDLPIVVHLMNGLPGETTDQMVASAQAVGAMDIQALKIHMLHIMKHTAMGSDYLQAPFPMLSKEDYIQTVIRQLEYIPAHVIIQRLTGDAPTDMLLAPQWTSNKTVVLNNIDKEMVQQSTWQSKRCT